MGGGRLCATVFSLDKKGPTYRFLAIREAFELEGSGKKFDCLRSRRTHGMFISELITTWSLENAR